MLNTDVKIKHLGWDIDGSYMWSVDAKVNEGHHLYATTRSFAKALAFAEGFCDEKYGYKFAGLITLDEKN